MFCPKCKYTTFDYFKACPKCNFNWEDIKKDLYIDWIIEADVLSDNIYKKSHELTDTEKKDYFHNLKNNIKEEQYISSPTLDEKKENEIEIDEVFFIEEKNGFKPDNVANNEPSLSQEKIELIDEQISIKTDSKNIKIKFEDIQAKPIDSISDEMIASDDYTVIKEKKEQDSQLNMNHPTEEPSVKNNDEELHIIELDDFSNDKSTQEGIGEKKDEDSSKEEIWEIEFEQIEVEKKNKEKKEPIDETLDLEILFEEELTKENKDKSK